MSNFVGEFVPGTSALERKKPLTLFSVLNVESGKSYPIIISRMQLAQSDTDRKELSEALWTSTSGLKKKKGWLVVRGSEGCL